MPELVMVHGIGQQHARPERLLEQWLAALCQGLEAAGLAQQVRVGLGQAAMLFYGDLFVTAGAMGELDEGLVAQDEVSLELAEQLAKEWVIRAHSRARDESLRRDGERALAQLEEQIPSGEPMGPRAAVRRSVAAAARLRYFATPTFAVAERLVNRDLRQVTAYLVNRDGVRDVVQERLAGMIDADTKAVIGHSLGSVAAYEACIQLESELPLLVTAGSPLGLDTIVYQRTLPQPPAYPQLVRRWVNVADPDDLVAATPNLSRRFPPQDGRHGVVDHIVDNGRRWHDAAAYLAQPEVVYPLAMTLGGAGGGG